MGRNRKLNRLKDYDYSIEGYYFVTVCTKDRQEWFGEIRNGRMVLNEWGEIVLDCWNDLPQHYPNLQLDQFVVMPNHVHGIMIIDNVGNGFKPFPTKRHGLSEFIRGFKTFSSRRINEVMVRNGFKPFLTKPFPTKHTKFQWQKSFHDHIIRNEEDLMRICEYITNNPLQWAEDIENILTTKK